MVSERKDYIIIKEDTRGGMYVFSLEGYVCMCVHICINYIWFGIVPGI